MFLNDRDLLLKIEKPSRYMGHEINAVRKERRDIDVSIVLAFPDVYEVGMSHQGLKILYSLLNMHEWIGTERVFTPWIDMENELKRRKVPLVSLESSRPLSDFDIIGFSLQHELTYTNVLTILDLAGIPFLSSERSDRNPLIIAGGPACFNPEPVADIFDAILVGDGEKSTVDICEAVRRCKSENKSRQELLFELKDIEGLYIPSFFKPHYHNGEFEYIEPLIEGYDSVKKAFTSDIQEFPFPEKQIVPFTKLIHDRLAIEISRGCTRGCRFCQAGMIYRPVRERSPDSVLKIAENALRQTGFGEISLLSLSSGDYSCIAPLLKGLMDRQSSRKIAVSLPSLRIDSIDAAWFEQIKRVRKTGFTMAPEAGSDRLRKIINKSLTNEDILNASREIYASGWKLIKLYFMIGLPGEEEQDLQGIIDLVREVANLGGKGGRRNVLNVSISTFVPKTHTPFMWEPQIDYEESRRRIRKIREGLKGSQVKVKWNQPELSWLEGIFSRGDRRLTMPLIKAWESGARFDAWGEQFDMDLWKNNFVECRIDTEAYLYRRRSFDEELPWGHISSGVSTEYLMRECRKAFDLIMTPDCREKCLQCGVCDFRRIKPLISNNSLTTSENDSEPGRTSGNTKIRVRLGFSKRGVARYLSHLEMSQAFIRAFRRAGLDIVHSEGYHPMPRISFACALPVGTESLQEIADIELYNTVPVEVLKEKINSQLPDGIIVEKLENITDIHSRPHIRESHFLITPIDLKIDIADLTAFIDADYFGIIKKTKKGEKEINARELVKSIELLSDGNINLILKHVDGPEIKPVQLITEIFKIRPDDGEKIKILKTGQVVG